MSAPSTETGSLQLRDVGPERSVLPRATEVSDRIQQLLDAMPLPDLDVTASFRRAQLQGYQLVLAYTFAWGRDLDDQEHAEWLTKLQDGR